MINGRNFLDQPVKFDLRTYKKKFNFPTDLGDYYTTGCFLNYCFFKKYYKIIAIDLNKQKALDTSQKEIQQTDFTGDLDHTGNTVMSFIIKAAKETVLDNSQGIMRIF